MMGQGQNSLPLLVMEIAQNTKTYRCSCALVSLDAMQRILYQKEAVNLRIPGFF